MSLLSKLLLPVLSPVVQDWIRAVFPDPVPVRDIDGQSYAALYMYLCRRERSPFSTECPFANIELSGKYWAVLYVGETEDFRKRHWQHDQQIGTCQEYDLAKLLLCAIKINKYATVRECDLDFSHFLQAVSQKQQKNQNKHIHRTCRNSIGWSLVDSVTWVEWADVVTRVRTEEVLIATLSPPLNGMRRR